MKKKFFAAICVFVLAMAALTLTSFAARKESLPITLRTTGYKTVNETVITRFEVTEIESYYNDQIQLCFEMDRIVVSGSNSISMEVDCFDAEGEYIKTVYLSSYSDYILVPDNTATIELKADTPASDSESYVYRKYVALYNIDGATAQVTNIQAATYQENGWRTAAQYNNIKRTLPINLVYDDGDITTISAFDITKVETAWDGDLRLSYSLEYEYTRGYSGPSIYIRCYNSSRECVDTMLVSEYGSYVDVPYDTTDIELFTKYGAADSQSYLISNYSTMYSSDGRSIVVSDLQISSYEAVGWALAVPVYAYENGEFTRMTYISPYDVSSWQAVGWYSYEETCNAETLYAMDENGKFTRTLKVPQRLVSAYTAVGWYTYSQKNDIETAVTLYAPDANGNFTRTISVPAKDVAAYTAVGWYTKEEAFKKTSLPVIFCNANGGTITFSNFTVNGVSKDDDGRTKIEYEIGYTNNSNSNFKILYNLYDAYGNLYGSVTSSHTTRGSEKENWTLRTDSKIAKIEIKLDGGASNSQTYVYSNMITVYASDGRTMEIYDLQLPVYEAVGWYSSPEAANAPPPGSEPEEPQEPEEPAAGSAPKGEKPSKPSRPPRS